MNIKICAVNAALLLLCASLGHVVGQSIRPPTSGGVGGAGGSLSGSGGTTSGQGGFGGQGGTGGGSSSGYSGGGGSIGGGGSSSADGSSGSFQSIQMCQRLTPMRDTVFMSADIACKDQIKCQVCGGPDKVRDACAATPACVAFSYETLTQCGYLQSKAAANNVLLQQRNWVSFAGGSLFPKNGVAAASIMDLCVTLRPLLDRNVQGYDLRCNGKATCEVCGTLDKIKVYCANSANCKGFTWNPSKNCGFLKQETTQGMTNTKGWITYSRA